MLASSSTIDVLGQFELHPILGDLGVALNLSQSPIYMAVACCLVLAFLYFGMKPAAIVPGRLQSAAELCYEFIRKMAVDTIGPEGAGFFPFIFSLFFFIMAGNYLGMLPFAFTYTSHIAVTFAMALMVFVLAVIVSLKVQGLHFFAHFMPAGAPKWLAPLLVPIEILSFLSRPVSLSIRLFANMVAGHVMFDIFASFVVMLASLGFIGDVLAVGPLVINMALVGLELLVGALQAYVFAILTCIYLREAVAH